MNLCKLVLGMLPLIALSSCEDNSKPLEVIETRRLTAYDDEGNLHTVMPKEWRRVPSSQFRDFNCKFGKSGEVYVSIATGGIKDNAERWLKQFGKTDEVVIAELEKLEVFGEEAVLLEAKGSFAGMRGVNKENAALLGLLVKTRGNLVTVKMVGDADEVKAQRENFIAFCKTLQWK